MCNKKKEYKLARLNKMCTVIYNDKILELYENHYYSLYVHSIICVCSVNRNNNLIHF